MKLILVDNERACNQTIVFDKIRHSIYKKRDYNLTLNKGLFVNVLKPPNLKGKNILAFEFESDCFEFNGVLTIIPHAKRNTYFLTQTSFG